MPLLLGICQALSTNCLPGSTPCDVELVGQKQCKRCILDFRKKQNYPVLDATDGVKKEITKASVKDVSAAQLKSILIQTKRLFLSESLSELDTILAELNQVILCTVHVYVYTRRARET